MAKTYSCLLIGLDVVEVEIETIIGVGFSGLTILGLRSDVTRDMRERVRSALESIGILIPAKRVVVNVSPQDILKLSRIPVQELDFAVAASIILALFADQGIQLPDVGKEFFAGELTLSGQLKCAQNILLYEKIAILYKSINSFSISLHTLVQKNSDCIFENYQTLGSWLQERKNKNKKKNDSTFVSSHKNQEFQAQMVENHLHNIVSTIKILLKNPKACVSILVAVAGDHHLLLAGEPGIGKSFSIQKMKNILLPPTPHEQIEIKLIHGNRFDINTRPFRSPHHSATTAALIGGYTLKPGEVTLAHHGVLFLDEIAEFSRQALEALREPLDSGKVELSKTAGSVSYPARFLLCATTNPCRCGYFFSKNKPCTCKPTDSRQYMSKISGPLLDRFCLQVRMENPNNSTDSDIFSNFLLKLDDFGLHMFAENFFHVQKKMYNSRNNFETNTSIGSETLFLDTENQENTMSKFNYEGQISLRAQNKLFNLEKTFRKIFPELSNENNFTDEILKYRNFSQCMKKDCILIGNEDAARRERAPCI